MKILYHSLKVFSLALLSPLNTLGQANFFDAITSDTIGKGSLYFQQQVSLSEDQVQLGTVLTWGLGKGWEAGVNIHQLSFERGNNSDLHLYNVQPEENPDVLLNIQKIFRVKEWYSFGAGTRSGFSYADNPAKCSYTGFYYLNNRLSLPGTRHKLTFGPYYANREYAGEGTNFGMMAGVQADIIKDKFSFIADFLSGTNALSNFNAGFQVSLPKNWDISVGAAVPLPDSHNDNTFLIQISKQ
jgi:hypothetical protein